MTKTLLALDPSGSFEEGQGTTGYSIWKFNEDNGAYTLIKTGNIRANTFTNQFDYFEAHIKLIETTQPNVIILEDYLLYAHKAMQQIGSKMETPQLIGLIKYKCNETNIEIVTQEAREVKKRWNDVILIYKGIIHKSGNVYRDCNEHVISRHAKDSIRHAMHYIAKRLKYGNR